jgi:hypothetical protein
MLTFNAVLAAAREARDNIGYTMALTAAQHGLGDLSISIGHMLILNRSQPGCAWRRHLRHQRWRVSLFPLAAEHMLTFDRCMIEVIPGTGTMCGQVCDQSETV